MKFMEITTILCIRS